MIKKLFSLFAIATLASLATYAEETTTNAPVMIEEQVIEKAEFLAADAPVPTDSEVILEETTEEAKLADCGCGCKGKKEGCDNDKKFLAGCGCKKKKHKDTDAETVKDAPTELLADNTVNTEETEEILPTELTEEKLASCCPSSCSSETEEILPIEVTEEKLASCCPSSCSSETKTDAAPIVEEVVEEVKLA